jgi:hypothetical protein
MRIHSNIRSQANAPWAQREMHSNRLGAPLSVSVTESRLIEIDRLEHLDNLA